MFFYCSLFLNHCLFQKVSVPTPHCIIILTRDKIKQTEVGLKKNLRIVFAKKSAPTYLTGWLSIIDNIRKEKNIKSRLIKGNSSCSEHHN